MALRNTIPVVATVVAAVAAGWLYVDNRRLEDQVTRLRGEKVAAADPWAGPRTEAAPSDDGDDRPARGGFTSWRRFRADPPAPAADKPASTTPEETRMERRQRRTRELEALLGRDADESEEDYRARILPMMQLALSRPRERVDEMRRTAEVAANVTDSQRQELDQAFGSIYDEVIQFTDGAIADGQLTPYGRNVTGMLQYAGGLGSILEGAEGRIGRILSPEQLRAMADSGFEWGEYLGLHAPWEKLRPPPPRPGS